MNIRSNESFDRIDPPPEQKQLRDIVHLIDVLSSDGISIARPWKQKEYPINDSGVGDNIVGIYVSKLKEKDIPFLASVSISQFTTNEKKYTDYRIIENEGRLRIYRREKSVRPEEELDAGEVIKLLRVLPIEEQEKILSDAFDDAIKGTSKDAQERDFERAVGESYVGSLEAKRVEKYLIKLAVKYNLLY